MSSAVRFRDRARADVALLGAAFAHGAFTVVALCLAQAGGPSTRVLIGIVLGVAMCWACNTVSHIHLHNPLFRSPAVNRLFSLYLSVLLTVPQRWWKLRHLAHHGIGDQTGTFRARRLPDFESASEVGLVVLMLATVAAVNPLLFVTVLVPALVVGYGLCAMQGHAEHARAAAGVDHHGHLYNLLWFNDGYHAAHHRSPCAHWTELAADVRIGDVTSAWPPVLRVIEDVPPMWNRIVCLLLDGLERAAMHVPRAKDFQLRHHTRAFSLLIPPDARARIRGVTVIGGGLFPRTVLVLAPILPAAQFTIVDREPTHLERARLVLSEAGYLDRVSFKSGDYAPERATTCDLLVVPLAFRGDKARFHSAPPAPMVVTHDWLWHRRGKASAMVSWLLVKRINLSASCMQSRARPDERTR